MDTEPLRAILSSDPMADYLNGRVGPEKLSDSVLKACEGQLGDEITCSGFGPKEMWKRLFLYRRLVVESARREWLAERHGLTEEPEDDPLEPYGDWQ